jgi:hypothetical protein
MAIKNSTVEKRAGSALAWWIGTLLATGAILVFFHFWAKPYLNVETEGAVQVPPERASELTDLVSQERLQKTVTTLASFGTRLTGSAGAEAAADYLSGELRSILGPESVKHEMIDVDNPFDCGTELDAGGERFRVHPFWAPVNRSYRLPKDGRSLGMALKTSLVALLSGEGGLAGRAAVLPLPVQEDLRHLVLVAARSGLFKGKLRDPLTKAEKKLLAEPGLTRTRTAEELRILDVMAGKHATVLADFLFSRVRDAGVRSLLLIEPATEPGSLSYRIRPRTFDDYILKHESSVPRYLVGLKNAGLLANGTSVTARQVYATLTVAGTGETMRIYHAWPNLVRTSSTPRAGLKGPLVYAGKGGLPEVAGKKLKGAIVLVDFNCSFQWVSLADLGAQAILFAEPVEIMRGEAESKYLSISANLPRFWVPKAAVEKLRAMEGREVQLDAQVVWEKRSAAIIVAKLPGRKPDAEPVVIETFYDSISVIPEIAPGGEQACGAAAMLELARVLKKYPLKKDVLFIMVPAHCQNLFGWREWLQRHYVPFDLAKKTRDPAYIKPAFVVHLDLTSRNRRLAVFFKGYRFNNNEQPIRRVYSNFGKIHAAMGSAVAKTLGYGDKFMVDAINAVSGRTWDSYIPGRFAIDQEVTVNSGLYGVEYMTPDDERAWVDTPHDLPGRMDFESLARQTKVLAGTLPNVLNVGAAFGSTKVKNFATSLKARVVEFDPKLSFLPNRTVSGAMVWVHTWVPSKSMKGVRGDFFIMAKGAGEMGGATMEVHGLGHNDWMATGWEAHVLCEAYEMDPLDGEIRFAPDRGPQGTSISALETDMNEKEKNLTLVVFPCRPFLLFDLVDPLRYTDLGWMGVLNAKTDSSPPEYGQSLPEGAQFVNFMEPLALAYAPEGSRLKFTFTASKLLGRRAALVNGTDAKPEGIGYSIDESDRLNMTTMHIAEDMVRLNTYRLGVLQRYGIKNNFLEDLNKMAKERLVAARKAFASLDYRATMAEARASWGLSARVGPDVENTSKSVVYSAMFYLALLIPFAVLAERLLFGFPNVTHQVGAAIGIFMAMFLAMYTLHPAFKIALTPLMILLAFVIIALSFVVIALISSRFFNFLREEREALMGVHKADVSKVQVTIAAFSLGVSNMRKRPLRTALTCTTLVVLTFAVLSLASVQQAVSQRKWSIGKPPAFQGLLFRSNSWAPMGQTVIRHLETEMAGITTPAPRAWFVSYQADRQVAVEITHGDKARATAVAALGMSVREVGVSGADKTLVAGRWFNATDIHVVLLPRKLAATLFIGPGDVGKAHVVMFGVPFTVIGLFDPAKLGKIRDLDDEEITPVNFEATENRRRSQNLTRPQEGELPQRYDHHDPSQVVIMQYDDLMRLGGWLGSVAVPIADAGKLKSVIEKLLTRLGLLVYVGMGKKTYAYSAIGGTAAEGLGNLFIPVLIAIFITFSTMLGAVQERKREISVFSSVGLSPSHVMWLFLAEAMVYAILGGEVGYLLGQGVSHLIVTGKIFPGLNVNFSAGSAIMAVVVVMGIVLLSAWYPAHLAGRLARPSSITGFTLPLTVADEVKLDLPFSFNARDAQAVTAYLAEFFDAHAEASAGEFSSGNIRLARRVEDRKDVWDLSVRVWLAPYDFGVSQDLVFSMQEGIGDESSASLTITRLSGDQSSWRRVNNRFLVSIRKQFLIWRALGETARARYHSTAAKMQDKGVAHATA